MRSMISIVPKNYGNISVTPVSKKCRGESKNKAYLDKNSQKNKKKINKYEIHKNLFFILFTSFFFNYKSTAVDFNETNKNTSNYVIVDGNLLGIKREDIFNEKFLFSNRTTQNTEIESEIEEIEDDEFRYSAWKNSQVGLTVGGSALSMWFAYKGLNVWEKWMKDQEKKDIEEEIELTGTYINPGAGNVESSIDPITGKKIEIKQEKKESDDKSN